jgi:hypothetical protein
MDPAHSQRIPVSIGIVAVLIIEDAIAVDQPAMLAAISKTILASLGRIPYIASVEAIRVVEIEPSIKTGRTQ